MNTNSYIVLSLGMALVPFLLSLATSYLKISIVLTIFRSGLGAQNLPSMMVIVALSLTLSMAVMGPVFEQSAERLTDERLLRAQEEPVQFVREDLADVLQPWKQFLLQYSGEREILLLSQDVHSDLPVGTAEAATTSNEEIRLRVLLPAFVLSELKRAFQMGLIILIPFLLIDLVVSTILVGLGMYMLSPVMVSLPLKLLVFTAADGWILLARSLLLSYGG
jgi:type III secretory pathway component EscR